MSKIMKVGLLSAYMFVLFVVGVFLRVVKIFSLLADWRAGRRQPPAIT